MIIPEIILHRVLVNGFRVLRRDSRAIDSMFRNLDQTSLQQVKDLVLKQPIALSINYPKKENIGIPAIVMLKKNSQEPGNGGFLGDHMGTSPAYGVPDEEISYETNDSGAVLGGASTSDLRGLGRKLFGPLQVDSTEDLTEQDLDGTRVFIAASDTQEIIDFAQGRSGVPSMNLHVISGTGAGQVLPIVRLTTESLDVEGSFDVQLDGTSLVTVREAVALGALGEPSRVYESTPGFHIQRIGTLYEATYQLNVLAAQPEHTIYLGEVVRAILFMHRRLLEEQGLQAMKISDSDLAPRSDFIPDVVYQRIMTLQFTYPFHVTIELETPTQFSLNIEPRDAYTHEFSTTLTSVFTLD